MAAGTLYIIDTMNQVYRAHYAIRQLTTSDNFPTNAIFGVAAMLTRLCDVAARAPRFAAAGIASAPASGSGLPATAAAAPPAMAEPTPICAAAGAVPDGLAKMRPPSRRTSATLASWPILSGA